MGKYFVVVGCVYPTDRSYFSSDGTLDVSTHLHMHVVLGERHLFQVSLHLVFLTQLLSVSEDCVAAIWKLPTDSEDKVGVHVWEGAWQCDHVIPGISQTIYSMSV